MGILEPRYARALYGLTAKQGQDEIKKSAECLDALADYFRNSESVSRFMLNPRIPAGAKRDAAAALLPEDAPENIKLFLAVLSDRNRMAFLPGIASAYRRILTENKDLLLINISSAYQLEDEQYERLGEVFAKRLSARAFTVKGGVDKTLLGGVRVGVGDRVFDGTLKMKLDKIKESLR